MHIEKLLLRDVGPFDDVTIEFPKGTDPQLADVYLLTGPNGTGKSTILYALASLIAGHTSELMDLDNVELGHELLAARIRSRAALAALMTDDRQVFAATLPGNPPPVNDLQAGFDGLQDLGSTLVGARAGSLVHWHAHGSLRYADEAAAFRPEDPSELRPTFRWAAFAYAGVRSVTDVEITAVQEPKRSPFEHSLSFVKTADTSQLANWIASQNFRRLKAKEAGHMERAEQLAHSVRDIETVIAEIVEDPGFGFVLTDEDDNVRVRWKGTVVRLGLLPDGLKSIVSWVADLLMRLDRIPWQDNTPVLQRRFLLLLDEVDIHLHPAWQRKVLPLAQRIFPNAQIIASTHSPFVVASVHDAQIGREYAARRQADPGYRFRWPRRDGTSVLDVVREALGMMTAGHCSYCDGHPLDATGVETVDHFRPKGRVEFYELVCTWNNLFLTCTACNHAKREQWDEVLLRPDDMDFRFERYFEVRFDSGALEPAATGNAAEQHRARRTIEILDLNRPGLCKNRLRIIREMRRDDAVDEQVDSWAYRYLLPVCRAA